MQQKAGAQISAKAFIQSVIILLILMITAGILTRVVPAGVYDRINVEGRSIIDTNSFRYVEKPNYPVWRWITVPIEVFTIGPDRLTVSVLVIFILLVGSSFAVMDKSGILLLALARLVQTFGKKKYLLLVLISLFFMFLGAFFGIIEAMIPLVPIMLGLAFALGWDSFVGLGMSILATNIGFSAAISNPFTIGVSQKIAGLPPFSGAGFRIIIFIVFFAVFSFFLVRYARKVEKNPQSSIAFQDESRERERFRNFDIIALAGQNPRMRGAMIYLFVFFALILVMFFAGSFIKAISDYTLPIVGLLFVIGGLGAGILSGVGWKTVGKAMWEGLTGIAPGIPLILMAASVKYIAYTGGIMDTILHSASQVFQNVSPVGGALAVYVVALVLDIFISSGSAKAFLLMPILLPLSDLIHLNRQIVVTAYCFGDGFSNLAYPTNAMLLIVLGLTVVSYPKWMRWTAPLWLIVVLLSMAFLGLAVAINFGPF